MGADTLQDTVKKLQDLGLVSESKGAQLIDLEKFKLGKAVIQKQGWCHRISTNEHEVKPTLTFRWDVPVPYPGHRGCHRAIRKVQIRQNDLCHRIATGPALRSIHEDRGADGLPVGKVA